MKKLTILSILFALTIPFGFCAEIQESTLNVDITNTKEYAPDTATLRFYVENTGLNIKDIKEKNDKIVQDAIVKIKAQLKTNETIKTINYSVSNIYSYKDKVRIFQKYQVRNGFEVKLKELDKVSQIIEIATSSGIKNVNNLHFSIENSEKICNEMLKETTIAAKNRASIIANSLGVSLDKPKSVNPYCSLNTNRIQPKRYATNAVMTMDAAGSAESSTIETIEAGMMDVRTSINMTYYLK